MRKNSEKKRFITPFFKVMTAVTRKDLQAERRSFEIIMTMLLFAMLAVLVFSFALELNREVRENSVAGVLWVTIIFSGMLGFSRSLAVEKDKGSLDALLIAPVPRSAIFYGKMLANLLFTLVIAAMLMVMLTVLFNFSLFKLPMVLVITLGCIGFTTVGTLLSSMSVQARSRESLLPIILLPVTMPIILTAVRASNAILQELKVEDWLPDVQLLALIDLIFLLAAFFLFDFIVEE